MAPKKPDGRARRILSLKDPFHPMSRVEVGRMIYNINFGLKHASNPDFRPSDAQIARSMAQHTEENHRKLDVTVRESMGLKSEGLVPTGRVGTYKRLYEEALRKREEEKKKRR